MHTHDGILTCDLCGLFLRAQHTVEVRIDGRRTTTLTVCLYHLDRLRDVITDAIGDEQGVRRVA